MTDYFRVTFNNVRGDVEFMVSAPDAEKAREVAEAKLYSIVELEVTDHSGATITELTPSRKYPGCYS